MTAIPWSTKCYAHLLGFIVPALVLLFIVDKFLLEGSSLNFDIWRHIAGAVILGLMLEAGFIQSMFNNFPGIVTRDYRMVTQKIKEHYGKPLNQAWVLFESRAVTDPAQYQVITWRESLYNFFRNLAVFFLIALLISVVINPSALTVLLFIAFIYCLAEARTRQKQLALILAEALGHTGK
jgi:hypothetical protein